MDNEFYMKLVINGGPNQKYQKQMILDGYITDPGMIDDIFSQNVIKESTKGIKKVV